MMPCTYLIIHELASEVCTVYDVVMVAIHVSRNQMQMFKVPKSCHFQSLVRLLWEFLFHNYDH